MRNQKERSDVSVESRSPLPASRHDRIDAMTDPIRTVLADDHELVRSGLRSELADDFLIVGEADDAEGAIDVITARQPDLVICDLHMPRGGGLAVVQKCATICPIVILTVSEAERDLLDAVAAGAGGYLLKTTPIDELRDSLRAAAAGEPVFSPSLAALVLGEFRRRGLYRVFPCRRDGTGRVYLRPGSVPREHGRGHCRLSRTLSPCAVAAFHRQLAA